MAENSATFARVTYSFDALVQTGYTVGTNSAPLPLILSNSSMDTIDARLAREAKAIVALAFRNGPIEDIHAGKACPACRGKQGYSRITDEEMKVIMQNAVDNVYKLLWLRRRKPQEYEAQITFGESHTTSWDDPRIAPVSK